MHVTIRLNSGTHEKDYVDKSHIQKNIDAVQRAIDGKLQARDFVLLMDTISILEGIQEKLPHPLPSWKP